MYKSPTRSIQIDLISSCNAKCLHCYRQSVVGQDNIHYEKNVHLDPKVLKQALLDPYFNNLEEILFCGNYGDALASHKLVELIDELTAIKPNLSLIFHTNGSLGSKDLWMGLAARLNGKGKFVKFAIDGLADTNHIYRKNVEWSSVMKNAQTFIAGGGRAVWMFIVFEHNQHQIEEARALSLQLGFAKFETRKNFAEKYNARYEQDEIHSASFEPSRTDYNISHEKLNTLDIKCESVLDESLYIDHDGRLWPCCHLPGWKYASDKVKRDYHIEKLESVYEPFFNSLYHFTPTEIMNHSLFTKDVLESWDNPEKIHYMCSYKCGKVSCDKQV